LEGAARYGFDAMMGRDRRADNQRFVAFLTIGIAGAVLFLGLVLFSPFFEPIAWAIILALFFHPVYVVLRRLLRRFDSLASLCMCILIVAFIIIPVFALLGSLTTEVLRVYTEFQTKLQASDFTLVPDHDKYPALNRMFSYVTDVLKANEQTVMGTLTDLSKGMGEFFLKQGTVVFRNVANIVFKAALMLVTLYYLFRDGERMLQAFKDLLPFPRRDVENFAKVTDDVLSATLYGNLLMGAIQGALGVFIFWILGFSAHLLWGMVMGLAAFLPMVGTALVWVPATIFLFVSGLYLKGALLLAFSFLVISQIDYFLRPLFISGKTQLHTLFLFFSILGGLTVFGFLGLFLGPVLIALCVSILEIYRLNYLGHASGEDV
jgi:predicted PurR-regulated permease PerM